MLQAVIILSDYIFMYVSFSTQRKTRDMLAYELQSQKQSSGKPSVDVFVTLLIEC